MPACGTKRKPLTLYDISTYWRKAVMLRRPNYQSGIVRITVLDRAKRAANGFPLTRERRGSPRPSLHPVRFALDPRSSRGGTRGGGGSDAAAQCGKPCVSNVQSSKANAYSGGGPSTKRQ